MKPSRFNLIKSIGPGIPLAAPVFAVINYRIVAGRFMPEEHRPARWLHVLSWVGILFLIGFSVVFVFSQLQGI
jgi:Mn2+/Fe2+ NRAMP family transporter